MNRLLKGGRVVDPANGRDGVFDVLIEDGRIDPSFIISHRWPLERAREAYQMWNDKDDDCTKIVLDPRPAIASEPGTSPS